MSSPKAVELEVRISQLRCVGAQTRALTRRETRDALALIDALELQLAERQQDLDFEFNLRQRMEAERDTAMDETAWLRRVVKTCPACAVYVATVDAMDEYGNAPSEQQGAAGAE